MKSSIQAGLGSQFAHPGPVLVWIHHLTQTDTHTHTHTHTHTIRQRVAGWPSSIQVLRYLINYCGKLCYADKAILIEDRYHHNNIIEVVYEKDTFPCKYWSIDFFMAIWIYIMHQDWRSLLIVQFNCKRGFIHGRLHIIMIFCSWN